MEPNDSNIRIPGMLMPSYRKLISTEEGRNFMKRIRVECGVCKGTRFYSIHRGITRIAGVVTCEGCRHFYQRFKRAPKVEHCEKGGRCFLQEEFPKKCTACGIAQIVSRCPVTSTLFNNLLNFLPTDLKNRMPDQPLQSSEVPAERRGGLGLEVYKGDTWEDVTDREDMQDTWSGSDVPEEGHVEEMDLEFEEMTVDDPGMVDIPPFDDDLPAPPSPIQPTSSRGGRARKNKPGQRNAADPDQRVMASLLEGLKINNEFMENFNPKTSERMRRKKKKVQYFNSSTRGRGGHHSAFHGPDGSLLASGKDLCDCLLSKCPGCHFLCVKCGSGKCGKECRINRKWYYDKVEVEGSTLSWNNEFVKKG